MKTLQTIKTIEELLKAMKAEEIQCDSISKLEKFIKSLPDALEFPKRPSKPSLKHDAKSEEVMEYAEELRFYEHDITIYEDKVKIYHQYQNKVNEVCQFFIEDASGLKSVPEQYRDKIRSLAYQRGHSEGHSGVLNQMIDLCDIFDV